MPERIAAIRKVASSVLEQNPGPVVHYRLLRDVLGRPLEDPELARTKVRLDESRRVRQLAVEQWPDGGWGRFHSMDARRKARLPTARVGVERALALGLDRSHPILDADRRLWLEIARRTFQSGAYNEGDEIQAHAELTGATVKDSYLVLNGRYQLNVLGSMPGMLPDELERALLAWLWTRPDGIGYLGVPLYEAPPCHQPGAFGRWLASLELLTRLFPAWLDFARESVEWLWAQRGDRGLWDLGPKSSFSVYLPLSDSWRRREDRIFDWTTRVLILLRQYFGPPRRHG